MIAEALKYLEQLLKDNTRVNVVPISGDRQLLVFPDGAAREIELDKTDREGYEVSDTRSFADLCEVQSIEEIYVSQKEIIGYHSRNRASERRVCRLKLSPSKPHKLLVEMTTNITRLPEFVRAIRGPLYGCYHEDVLKAFRAIDFTRRNDGTRSISHKGESLGRSIEAQAQSREGDIPEQIVFNIPYWSLSNSPKCKVLVAVEMDPTSEAIRLIPVGDTFDNALAESIDQLMGVVSAPFAKDFSPQIYRG